jgi:catechol 2,3-dioxygenase-like lactoylglutathione lyase family enzyme
MGVTRFDHVAVPTAKPEEMLRFYKALGFEVPDADAWRASGKHVFTIQFGDNKINVHAPALWQRGDFTLRGPTAQPGCGDFCFVWSGTPDSLKQALDAAGAAVEVGPVPRVGGRSGGRDTGSSVYTRDPDGNLLEFMIYPVA